MVTTLLSLNMQEGGSRLHLKVPQLDQGGQLGQGRPGPNPNHKKRGRSRRGRGEQNRPPSALGECEYVHEIAFHNVPIEEHSQDATAFVCMYGLFKFLRMPFGLRNAGSVYCQLVSQLMDNLGLESVAHYLEDILIHIADVHDHLVSMDKVLRAHLDAGITLKLSKTLFLLRKS